MATDYHNEWSSSTTSAVNPMNIRYEYFEPTIIRGWEYREPIRWEEYMYPKVKDLQCSEGWDPDEN